MRSLDALRRADRKRKSFLGKVVEAQPGISLPDLPATVTYELTDPDGDVWIRYGMELVPRWKTRLVNR